MSGLRKIPFTIDKMLIFSPFFKTYRLLKERGLKGLLTQLYVVSNECILGTSPA
jgi:hypothetical protein